MGAQAKIFSLMKLACTIPAWKGMRCVRPLRRVGASIGFVRDNNQLRSVY